MALGSPMGSVMMPIPLDLLEEAGIDMYTPIQMYISHGRIVIQVLEEDPFADETDCAPCCCPRCRAHTREGCPG